MTKSTIYRTYREVSYSIIVICFLTVQCHGLGDTEYGKGVFYNRPDSKVEGT